ncbi:hypothetical protein BH10PSE19_BH10PSE19_01680 [soil metagenome]
MKCSQCDKPAISNQGYCLACHEKINQIHNDEVNRASFWLNTMGYADKVGQFQLGLTDQLPIPPKLSQQNSNVTLNHNNQIGVINSGNMHAQSIDITQNNHNIELTDAIKQLTEAIATRTELGDEIKKEIHDSLEFITKEANKPAIERNKSVLKIITHTLGELCIKAGLKTIWENCSPHINSFFN